jgi:fatty-acyl-CoA synthase
MALPLNPLRCLERAVTVFPRKMGVVCGDKRFSYAELGERCGRLASTLEALDIKRGDRVAYLSFNTHKLLEAYFGVVQAGGVVMPLNVRLTAGELAAILNHAQPPILFYEDDFAPLIPVLRANCASIRHFVALDDITDSVLHYESLIQQYAPAPLDPSALKDDETAELFYTSGSTGVPKGVMLSNRALYMHALAVAGVYTNPASVVDLHTIPLFHANGWGHAHASTMLGVTQVMVRRFDPGMVLGLIEQHRATDMCLVPTMANALLNLPGVDQFDLSSMRQIVLGGAASSPPLIERLEKLFHCDVFAGYGLTESGPMISLAREKNATPYSSDTDRWHRRAMTGWSFPGVSMRVVDQNMNDVPQDMKSIGEIITSCDWLMTGYYKDPEGTAAALTGPKGEPGGVPGRPVWLHTGDMAVWDEEGFVLIVDRKKEIIISGGENISSLEIEKVIYAHPGVLECAVVAAPDTTWGEVPVAIVVKKPGNSVDEYALMGHMAQSLSKFKLPRRVEFVEGPLPKTGTGKIKKIELREPFWKDHAKRVQG